ncbi:hypothetical protein N431DRAFT_547753 [Stipitochalara longipes BDJ]|nr:hypothetical protein N431DRAFT_547753 [Stipitochalara longipes BDJ]
MAPHADVDDDRESVDVDIENDEDGSQVDVSEGSDEGEDDDDEDEDEDEELDLKKRLDEIITDLKSGSLDLRNPTQCDAFIARNSDAFRARTPENQYNLLHLLAISDKETLPPIEKLDPLVKILVRLPEDLLAARDGELKTPLYIAATRAKKMHRLLRVMCEAHANIDSILGIQCFDKETCLHFVIRKKIPQAHILYLIGLAGKETLCVKDNQGNTPLHHAVNYELCSEDQIKIVRALVAKSDASMDIANKKGLSPYRYHEETHSEANNKAKKAQQTPQRSLAKELDRGGSQGKPEGSVMDGFGRQDRWDPRQHGLPAAMPNQGPPPPRPLQRVNTMSNAPPGKYGVGSSRTAAAQVDSPKIKPTIETNEEQVAGSVDGKTLAKRPNLKNRKSSKGQSKTKDTKEETKPSPETANAIKSFLKLHYLRTRKHDAAVEFLYGPSQERQIYFDLYGCGPTISQSWIKSGVDYLRFEDVLQYVAVPQVQVESQPASQQRGSKRQLKRDGLGRTDLVFLFKWLKGERSVKTILKVIVDDLQEPAHSDEAIEAALKGMSVEDWDWRKTDLCLEVIHAVAPTARIVHLYWSGNNAILRGWSEPEGLAKLEKLEKVNLHIVRQGLETSERTNQYVRAFKERMKKHCPNVAVDSISPHPSTMERSAAQVDAQRAEQEVRHRWLITMDEFADFLQNMERSVEPPLVLEEPITVALIDDGIDINDISLQSRIVGGRSFCHRNMEQNLNQPYYVSSGGHGTAMASLICRICPSVKLYVLKLDEYVVDAGKRQITAESAAKAVVAAVDKGVHIISMSWTIERTDANAPGIALLEKAIELAANSGILMFCAATDQGAYTDRSYPAASSTKKLFKIGAAEASGTALKWLGDQKAVDFIFPGHNVVKERPGDVPIDKHTSLTGSSVATALAAGLAAVILYSVQAGALTPTGRARERGVSMDDFRALKKHNRMRDAFLEIGTTDESEKKYIAVWERFKAAVKRAEVEPRDTWIDIVTDLAALLKKRQL